MRYTKVDIWNDLSELQATQFKGKEWQKEIRIIMRKIDNERTKQKERKKQV
jgi:hypothetical protein